MALLRTFLAIPCGYILGLSFLAACWAPEVAPSAQPAPVMPEPAPDPDLEPVSAPESETEPASQVEPVAAAAPSPPTEEAHPPMPTTPIIEATPPGLLPTPPFTAWTTRPDLKISTADGKPVATLHRIGIRVTVLAVTDAGVHLQCTGCTGAAREVEGWVPHRNLRASGGSGQRRDPLAVALMYRASWASGDGLPQGATNNQVCLLVDRGFQLEGGTARWATAGGILDLVQRKDGAWMVESFRQPTRPIPWTCRVNYK